MYEYVFLYSGHERELQLNLDVTLNRPKFDLNSLISQ